MTPPTALVVYPSRRKHAHPSVREQLSRTGFNVESRPADTVLGKARPDRVDVVVYDPMMGSGAMLIEAKRYVRTELRRICERFPETPVLITTVNFDAALLKAALEVGATALIPHRSVGLAARNLARVVMLVGAGSSVPARIDVVPEFHDPKSGTLQPLRVAAAYGISLATLSRACGVLETKLTNDVDHADVQRCLAELEFIWATLRRMLGSDELASAWLHARHPELNGETPLSLSTDGSATQLAEYLRSALAGETT